MSAGASGGGKLLIDAIDFQVPCRRFTIKANVTRERQMPVVDEFVLRLVSIVQRISVDRLAGYFGFSGSEIETVLLELNERGLLESDDQEIFLSPRGQDLFKGLTEGELPRLALVESWTDGVWFDLVSRNIMTPARYRPLPNLLSIREQPNARQVPESYARAAFEQNFHDYARRVRRHPDADQLAIYSVSEVEAGIYGYQPMPAECWLDRGTTLETHVHLPFADNDPARFSLLSMAAVDVWAMLAGPEQSASGLADYERLTGDDRPARLRQADGDAATWSQVLAPSDKDGDPLLFGATYLDYNVGKLCDEIKAALSAGRTASGPPSIIWLRPGGTAWGRTFKVGDMLQRIRETLSSGGIKEAQTTAIVPRAVPTGHRRHLKRIFDEGRLAPTGSYPADLEIIAIPGIAAMVALHMDVGRHGAPIGIASRSERLLRAIDRRFNENRISASDTLWTVPTEGQDHRSATNR